MRKISKSFLLLLFINFFLQSSTYKTGVVIDKKLKKDGKYLKIEEIKIKSGNSIFKADNFLWDEKNYNTELKKNDRIYFKLNKYGNFVCGYKRDIYSIGLIIFTFIILILFLGKKRILSAFSIPVNFILYLFVFIPVVKKGFNITLSVLILSVIVSGIAIVLNSGFKKKGILSFLTIISVVLVSFFIDKFIVKSLKISGIFAIASRQIVMAIHSLGWKIENLENLVVASFVLASLGAVIDTTVCLSSSAYEILDKNFDISNRQLFSSLENIWRKVFSMMTGGILFVYLGAGFSFFFLIYILSIPFIRFINWEFMTIFVAGGVVSVIGLIFVFPFLKIYLKFLR